MASECCSVLVAAQVRLAGLRNACPYQTFTTYCTWRSLWTAACRGILVMHRLRFDKNLRRRSAWPLQALVKAADRPQGAAQALLTLTAILRGLVGIASHELILSNFSSDLATAAPSLLIRLQVRLLFACSTAHDMLHVTGCHWTTPRGILGSQASRLAVQLRANTKAHHEPMCCRRRSAATQLPRRRPPVLWQPSQSCTRATGLQPHLHQRIQVPAGARPHAPASPAIHSRISVNVQTVRHEPHALPSKLLVTDKTQQQCHTILHVDVLVPSRRRGAAARAVRHLHHGGAAGAAGRPRQRPRPGVRARGGFRLRHWPAGRAARARGGAAGGRRPRCGARPGRHPHKRRKPVDGPAAGRCSGELDGIASTDCGLRFSLALQHRVHLLQPGS